MNATKVKELNFERYTVSYGTTSQGNYVGCIKELFGVISQGKTLSELKENLADAAKASFAAGGLIEGVPIWGSFGLKYEEPLLTKTVSHLHEKDNKRN